MRFNEGREPWAHQKAAIDRAEFLDNYALFFEMGAGKSGTAINMYRQKCYQAGRMLRALILCPPVVRTNWKAEIKMNASEKVHRRTLVLEGPSKKRTEILRKYGFENGQPTQRVFITNYEGLQNKDFFKALEDFRAEVIIFDESHKLKNFKAKRTQLAIKLADKARHRFILTGTPILNTPMDIWSQYRILDGGASFDSNFYAFRGRYFIDHNAGMPSQKYFPNWQPIPKIAEEFNEKIYCKASRVMKKDCLDLPPIVRKRLEVGMEPKQWKLYKDMAKHFVAYLDDKACVASIALTKGLRLQQIVSGFFIDDNEEVHIFENTERINALLDCLEGIIGHSKVIVWASFKANYDQIAKAIRKKFGEDINICTITGGMTDKERNESIDNFQTSPEHKIMIANQQAGGTGVNLTAASFMVYFSRSYSLEADTQSEARCHRGGSEVHESITRIDLVTPDTMDDIVLEALARKENMANNILKIRNRL